MSYLNLYMIISHKYRCIFIRVPKTGSTSFEKMWLQIDPECVISNNDTPPYGHYYASQLKAYVGIDIWTAYFKFAFIREPISWFKSQYTYNMRYNHRGNDKLKLLLNDSWTLNDNVNKQIQVNDSIKFYVMLKEHFQGENQLRYIDEELDFIGVFENYNEDVGHIFKILNIQFNYDIMHLNNSSSSQYTLTKESEEFVHIILKDDIKFYKDIIVKRESST